MAEKKPGEGLWGWLGRQVGHVKKAVKTDVTKKPIPPESPQQQGDGPSAEKAIVYREEKAEEVELPDRPGVVLRRTTIDEVIVDPQKAGQEGDDEKK